ATAIQKQAALDAWLDERMADLRVLSSHGDLVEEAAAVIAATPGSARALLLQELDPHVTDDGSPFTELFITEPSTGRVAVSTNRAEEGKTKTGRPYFENGKTRLFLQAPYRSGDITVPGFTAAIPLRDRDGRVVAVLAARIKLENVEAVALRRSGLHQTEEAFLF